MGPLISVHEIGVWHSFPHSLTNRGFNLLPGWGDDTGVELTVLFRSSLYIRLINSEFDCSSCDKILKTV